MSEKTPIKLAYASFKPKEDSANSLLSPVIFLHALTCNKDSWLDIPQLTADKTKRLCYAVDARNHGDSDYTDTFDLASNAIDLVHFLNTIQVQSAILVGFSMGGYTAIDTALKNPYRVEKIIVIDVATKPFPKETVDKIISYINSWMSTVNQIPKDLPLKEAAAFALDILYSNIPQTTLFAPKEVKRRTISKLLIRKPDGTYNARCNLIAILECFKNFEPFQAERTKRFSCPALFINGELSPGDVGQKEDHIREFFPNAELIEFKGASHGLIHEFPELFLQTLTKFVSRK